MTIHYWQIGMTIVATIALFIAEHRFRRLRQRKCECGYWFVRRFHKMINVEGNRYQTFTFTECPRCDRFRLAKTEDRDFTEWEIDWRKRMHADQFIHDERLFDRLAGIKEEIHPALFQTQLKRFERMRRLRATIL